MKEHPALFSTDMVCRILRGEKTHTRRLIQFPRWWDGRVSQDEITESGFWNCWQDDCNDPRKQYHHWQYGDDYINPNYQVGDRLWVRETWRNVDGHICYKATPETNWNGWNGWTWKPSIHMPRWASRINLEITNIWAERLQAINGHDATLEGWPGGEFARITALNVRNTISGNAAVEWFIQLWNSIYAKRGFSWEVNPWVWAIEFKRV